jgi:membrane-bound inhibitor of C-type lysozyme
MNNAMLTFSIHSVFRKILLLALPVFWLAACETIPGGTRSDAPHADSHPEAAVAPAHVIAYNCDDGRMVEVTLNGPERAQLKINGATAALTGVRSASGAKFQSADGSITFWSKGNEATIDTVVGKDKQTHMVCTIVQP